MRKITLCLTLMPVLIALLVVSCGPKVKIEAPEKPIKVETKVEPIEIKIEAKVELHIYQHAVRDVNYITGAQPPKTGEPQPPAEKKIEEESALPPQQRESKAGDVLLQLLGIGTAHAETASDEQQLRQTLDSMRRRHPALKKYKADKSVGENHRGYVQERPSEKMSNADYAKAVRATIAAENADRRLLYQVRGRMDGVSAEKEAVVYAKAWRDSAGAGEWIEVLVDKKWVWKQK